MLRTRLSKIMNQRIPLKLILGAQTNQQKHKQSDLLTE